jgi:hypothetical protein
VRLGQRLAEEPLRGLGVASGNGTPTLLLCGQAGREQLDACDYPYLGKPFSLDELWIAARHEIAQGE